MIRAVAVAALIASPVAAEVPCGPRDKMAEQLLEVYGESLSARFLTANDRELVEVFTGDASWTIVVTDAAGKACMIAVGTAWTMQGVPRGEPG